MRAVIQRVSQAKVVVEKEIVGQIDHGLLVLLGVEDADTDGDIEWLAQKLLSLRIFSDEDGLMNRDIRENGGSMLVVSQFTLHAKTKKGNRPSFIRAAKPGFANTMYAQFCTHLEALHRRPVAKGVFGAHMDVHLINDGPVTILIDTKNKE